jgi:ribose-phosphate pyrophosphokinase
MRAPFSELRILSGNAHPHLAERICSAIGVRRGDATVTTFPDGESFVKINENVRGATSSWSSRPARRRTTT